MHIILIGLFGSLGVLLRYVIDQLMSFHSFLTTPVILCNVIGCLLFGFASHYLDTKSDWHFLVLVGFCGGLTTFSSFIFEILKLLKSNQFFHAFIYLSTSIFLGMVFMWLGTLISQHLLR